MEIVSHEVRNGQQYITCFCHQTGEKIRLVCPVGIGKKKIIRAAWGAVRR